MSPLTLRRYRAERLLRREFAGMQTRVIGSVAARLRGCGVRLDDSELEACYAAAWQGLYMAMLEGQEIVNPAGWLVLVTFRRAIEEQRSRARLHRAAEQRVAAAAGSASEIGLDAVPEQERDLAAELDDRARLRHLFEGLRVRLSEREREAAVLCYLQGLPRAEAAARMGVSEARMRKLMDGSGAGSPGVAGKVGALVRSIRDGEWCEEQGSLMRGLAFGILDPAGERYRIALAHRGECPACRAYVVSLRGLAAALPPTLLPWGLGGGVLARLGEGAHSGAANAASSAAGAGSGGQLGGGLAGAASTTGAVGGGGAAAGGGWLLAGGPLGAKLAVGCLLAVGVGAGCAALEAARHAPAHIRVGRAHTVASSARTRPLVAASVGAPSGVPVAGVSAKSSPAPDSTLAPAAHASREFGLEQGTVRGPASGAAAASSTHPRQLARVASAGSASAESGSPQQLSASSPRVSSQPSSTASTQAVREFSPG